MMRQKRNTVFLMAGILILALAAFGIQQFFLKKEGGSAFVQKEQQEVYRLSLEQETEVTVKTENGYNKIEVKNGAIAVTEADCPDKTCVNTGYISKTGEVIACLPHEVLVTIEGAEGRQDAAVR